MNKRFFLIMGLVLIAGCAHRSNAGWLGEPKLSRNHAIYLAELELGKSMQKANYVREAPAVSYDEAGKVYTVQFRRKPGYLEEDSCYWRVLINAVTGETSSGCVYW